MSWIIALISGLLMSIQGVWNTRLTEKVGLWFANSIEQLGGLIVALIVLAFVKDANLTGLKAVNKMYLLTGAIGAGIVYTVILSISRLGPAQATMLILIAQMLGAYCIQLFGLFGEEKIPFQWMKLVGVAVMLVGIVIFQWEKVKK
ncbi:MAG: DMT family transporter [Cellulosilyticaceae bacterium]